MIQGIELRRLVDSSALSQCEIAKRAKTSQSSLAHQMVRGCSESYYNKIKKAIEQEENTMKNSPIIRITMEGVEGYVEVTRAVMDALIFTTTDHQKYAEENYTDGSKKAAEELKQAQKDISNYLWQDETRRSTK